MDGKRGGLEFLRNDSLSSTSTRDGMPGRDVTSLLEDHAGRLWVGVDGGLTVYDHGFFRPILWPDGGPVGIVVAMTEDTAHDVWAQVEGRHCYLIRIKDLKVSQEISMPSGHTALALAADPRGGIWLGLVNGDLAHYRDGRFERSSLIMVGTLARSCALWLMPTGRCGAQPSKDFSAGRMGRCRP